MRGEDPSDGARGRWDEGKGHRLEPEADITRGSYPEEGAVSHPDPKGCVAPCEIDRQEARSQEPHDPKGPAVGEVLAIEQSGPLTHEPGQ